MIHFDEERLARIEKRERTGLFNQLTGGKPAFLAGTRSLEGLENMAIFSNVIHLGANPPLVGILFRPDTVVRHTLENYRETNSLGLSLVATSFVEQAHKTSARYEQEAFEANAVGLETINRDTIPYVKDSPVHIKLRFVEEYKMLNDTILVAGEIEEFWLADHVMEPGHQINLEKALGVSACGLYSYYGLSKLATFSYAKPN